jgi:hypothetical protein
MKPALSLITALIASSLASTGAVIIYNQDSPPTPSGLPAGGWGNYKGFSFSYGDSALSADTDGSDETSLPTTLLLTDLVVRRAGTASGGPIGDPSDVLIKVYSTQTPTTASWIGDSVSTGNMAAGISEDNVSFSFDKLALDSEVTYWFYFANAGQTGNLEIEEITFASGRMRVSNHADHTYGSGNVINGATQGNWAAHDGAFDAVFQATFVPEPTIALLGGIGLITLLRRRRD